MFNRNGINFQTTGLAGENNTYAGEGVLSGIYQKASFSLGGFHFQTDGWRNNADQKDSIGNAFLQLELSPQTSIQGEYRYRDTSSRGSTLRFAPDDFFADRRMRTTKHNRYVSAFVMPFRRNSDFIGNFMYQDADRRLHDCTDSVLQLS